MILFTTYLVRLGCAFVLGTIIGVERQMRQRNAGLRTNILVAVGAAAFTILSYAMTSGNGDPSRVAAQIVSGIGFLGGGLIIKDGLTVRGLNTAATIWCSAACGTLSGVGLYAEAAVLVICVLMTHCLFRRCALFLRNVPLGFTII
uniref:MgtC/SapB family protein n=1 Tax=Prevotellamassilia timonensis TaxID=1852370 RepID=UPI004038E96C